MRAARRALVAAPGAGAVGRRRELHARAAARPAAVVRPQRGVLEPGRAEPHAAPRRARSPPTCARCSPTRAPRRTRTRRAGAAGASASTTTAAPATTRAWTADGGRLYAPATFATREAVPRPAADPRSPRASAPRRSRATCSHKCTIRVIVTRRGSGRELARLREPLPFGSRARDPALARAPAAARGHAARPRRVDAASCATCALDARWTGDGFAFAPATIRRARALIAGYEGGRAIHGSPRSRSSSWRSPSSPLTATAADAYELLLIERAIAATTLIEPAFDVLGAAAYRSASPSSCSTSPGPWSGRA